VNPHNFENFLLGKIRQVTAKTYVKRLKLLGAIADLDDADRMKTLICTYQASESYKELLANAYDHYVGFRGLCWVKLRFNREDPA